MSAVALTSPLTSYLVKQRRRLFTSAVALTSALTSSLDLNGRLMPAVALTSSLKSSLSSRRSAFDFKKFACGR